MKTSSAVLMAIIGFCIHLAASESANTTTNQGDIGEQKKQELLNGLNNIRLLVAKLKEKKAQFGSIHEDQAQSADQGARLPKRWKGFGRRKRLRRRRKLKWKKAFRKFWRWLRNSRKRRRQRLRRKKAKKNRLIPENRDDNRKFFHQTFSLLDKNNY